MKGNYHIYALITIIGWSLAYVFTRMALVYVTPYTLGFLRYLVATITMVIIAIAIKLRPPKKKDLGWFILAGFTGFFLYMVTFNSGSQTVSAATSSLIIATTPMITAVLARLFLKERLRGVQYLAIVIAFAGVGVLTVMENGLTLTSGLLFQLGSAGLLSTYNLLQRKLTKEYSSLRASTYSIFAGTVMLCIFIPGTITEVATMPREVYLYIFILGVFASAIAYCSWSKAMSLADNTASVSNYMFLTPLITGLLGIWIAHEAVDLPTIIGGIIILGGLILFSVGKKDRINKAK